MVIMAKKCLILVCLLLLWGVVGAQESFKKEEHALIQSERADGRFMSSYAIAHELVKNLEPEFAFKESMTAEEMPAWQQGLREAMGKIMKFPVVADQPAPKRISVSQREGYSLEKWEFYPFPHAVSTFLVLKPDKLNGKVPGILCIPGAGRTKEGLAGEKGISDRFTENITSPKVTMALDYVKAGYVAVAVDNAAAGEASDLEKYHYGANYDYDVVSRMLLEIGWSWLGYTSYLDKLVLDWMKTQPYIRQDRLVVSGFSLGTEPMMVLGALDKDIFAFVYNDFLCQTQERASVMTMPNEKGRRGFPNSIRHLIPDFWRYFNFPDIVASFAPRPVILTEGGLDRDFNRIKAAYKLAGAPENVECHHYPKFARKEVRLQIEHLPGGVDRDTFFKMANVDPPAHYFKHELVLPWLEKVLNKCK